MYRIHDHGEIRVIDKMGDDSAVVQAARVSYGKGTKTKREDRGLIRYLMRHRHTTPFEMCTIKLYLKMPIFVARQWVRHRTASINEYSGRYSEMPNEFYSPALEDIKPQSKTNKQGRAGEMSLEERGSIKAFIDLQNHDSYETYKLLLERGTARELARVGLPLSQYTEFFWQMNLHNLLHFCSLRSDPHAQKEIRDYSDVILHKIIKEWVPNTYEAFMDYVMDAHTFSGAEMKIIRVLASDDREGFRREFLEEQGLSGREITEFEKKTGVKLK